MHRPQYNYNHYNLTELLTGTSWLTTYYVTIVQMTQLHVFINILAITWVAIGKHSAKISLSTIAEASVHHYVCLSVDTFVYVFRRGVTASATGGGIIIDW